MKMGSPSTRRLLAAFGIGILLGGIVIGVHVMTRSEHPERVAAIPERTARVADASPPTLVGMPRAPASGNETSRQKQCVVLSEEGNALPTASARVVVRNRLFTPTQAGHLATATAEGLIDLPSLQGDDAWLVEATGYVPAVLAPEMVEGAAPGRPTPVVLRRGKSVKGLVVDPWGRPVSGATILAQGRFGGDLELGGGGIASVRTALDLVSASTGADGQFEVSGIAALPMRLRVVKADYLDLQGVALRTVGDSEERVKITLFPMARTGVKLLDAESGAPIEEGGEILLRRMGALALSAYDFGARPTGTVPSGWDPERAERWFTFRLPGRVARDEEIASEVEVECRAVGYEAARAKLRARTADDPAYSVAQVVHLPRSAPQAELGLLRVKARWSLARPLPWVYLRVFALVGERREPAEGRTIRVGLDEQGVGVLRLPAGDYEVGLGNGTGGYWLKAHPGGVSRLSIARQSETSIEFQVHAGVIRLSTVDADGDPLPQVFIQGAGRVGFEGAGGFLGTLASEDFWGGETLRDYGPPQGRPTDAVFEFVLAPGEYQFAVQKLGFRTTLVTASLRDGSTEALRAVLTPE